MMVIDPADIGTQSVLIDGTEIERVNTFKYLGRWSRLTATVQQI